ncbi:MAG: phenylphosphate carboxylase subunit delta [Candidatus Adiutrix sp.]|jgi:3-deoxy-D-manno-octulosonate 8-phosphate phosphatase (KDO 8-P phosphatase)|nr:phenylphosphate carboxylase subunit delta [Candidatus Adiutrix sp.]
MNVKADFSAIKLLGLDVDGVLTDGRVIFSDSGEESKFFYSRDNLGLKILKRLGLEIAIVTGRRSRVVEHYARDLEITELHQKIGDKWPVFEDLLRRRGLSPGQAAFAGDDLVDLPVLRRVGLALAPAGACPEVLAQAHFVSPSPGGRGAVRQMAEFILKGQGRWDEALQYYLK